jgi:hypothetical protein
LQTPSKSLTLSGGDGGLSLAKVVISLKGERAGYIVDVGQDLDVLSSVEGMMGCGGEGGTGSLSV